MSGGSYYFDPCSVDGSDNEKVTLDNWKPSPKVKAIPKSEWRQQQIAGNYNQQPSKDDHKKILSYLKKGYPDYQIMDAFGINCQTLEAIKEDRYSPVEGIALSDIVKITKKFNQIDKKLTQLKEAMTLLVDVFKPEETIKRMQFKTLVCPKSKKKKDESGEEE